MQPLKSALEAKPTLHCAQEISGVGKLRHAKNLERLRFQLFVEDRDTHPAALGQRKDRQSERLPCSKRAAKGAGFAQSLLCGTRDR